MLDEHRQVAVTLEADHLLGPYRLIDEGFAPCGLHFGDFDLVTNLETGRAFVYFEHPHSELICADLNDDFTGVSGHFTRHFPRQIRSEEHTSELQSLMRITYAVFCLTKKHTITYTTELMISD